MIVKYKELENVYTKSRPTMITPVYFGTITGQSM